MSMINPRDKAQLQNLLMAGHREIQEEEKEVELPGAKEERRNSIDMKDFYDERPNNAIFLETSKEQDERVRKNSPFGGLKTWRLIKLIVKSNDDVR